MLSKRYAPLASVTVVSSTLPSLFRSSWIVQSGKPTSPSAGSNTPSASPSSNLRPLTVINSNFPKSTVCVWPLWSVCVTVSGVEADQPLADASVVTVYVPGPRSGKA